MAKDDKPVSKYLLVIYTFLAMYLLYSFVHLLTAWKFWCLIFEISDINRFS